MVRTRCFWTVAVHRGHAEEDRTVNSDSDTWYVVVFFVVIPIHFENNLHDTGTKMRNAKNDATDRKRRVTSRAM